MLLHNETHILEITGDAVITEKYKWSSYLEQINQNRNYTLANRFYLLIL